MVLLLNFFQLEKSMKKKKQLHNFMLSIKEVGIQIVDRRCAAEAHVTGYDWAKKIFLALHTENKTTGQTLVLCVHSELV